MVKKEITLEDLYNQIQQLLIAVTTTKTVLNLKEAAAYTNLATSYLYKLTSTQEIPHFCPRGKMLYFNRDELDLWMQQNRIKSNGEINKAANDHINGEVV